VAKKSNWRFWLFLFGAILSCAVAIGEIILLVIPAKAGIQIELTWVSAAVFAFSALLPTILFGAPYINSKFYFSYSKDYGFNFGEEKRTAKRSRGSRGNAIAEAGACSREE
jgi:hypothetical protein